MCWNNQIKKIENLPDCLKRFDCENNQIEKIENLPISLIYFHYNGNQIKWVDNVEFNRINFTIKGYQSIRRIQLRMKRRFKIKNNSSRIIGRQALHWLHSPNGPMMMKNMKLLIEQGYLS